MAKATFRESTFDYSHLGDTEQIVIESYLKGEFERYGINQNCKRLAEKHGESWVTFRSDYIQLRRFGTLDMIKKPPPKHEMKLLAFRIPVELREKLKAKVLEEETSIQAYLTRLIEESL